MTGETGSPVEISRREMLLPALRRLRGPALAPSRRVALVEPVADAVAWDVLAGAVRGQADALAERIGARCEFGSIGADPHVVLGEGRDGQSVRLALASGVAHRFWCGLTREALMVMQGAILLSGSTAACFDFLRALPVISRMYRHAAGYTLEAPPRLNVLTHLQVTGASVRVLGLSEALNTDDDSDRVGFTAALILGLHPLCRSIELRGLAGALADKRVPHARAVALAALIAGLEPGEPALGSPAGVA